MATNHSLENLKRYHNEATQFFGAELLLLKEVIDKITDERLAKASVLLISCGQTGSALLQLANQTDCYTNESVMLARAFMEKITNFCYVGVCEDNEYKAFLLHPIYKHYHNIGTPKMEDDFDSIIGLQNAREEKQKELKKNPIVEEALSIFSESNPRMNWTKKNLSQRISVIKKWGKLLDVFFTLNKIQYYSDASEILHGSLYGSTYSIGLFDPEFDRSKESELEKKLYKDSTCILLHLGTLIHEAFTLISYSNDIKSIWDCSYENRGQALNLLFHVLEKKH